MKVTGTPLRTTNPLRASYLQGITNQRTVKVKVLCGRCWVLFTQGLFQALCNVPFSRLEAGKAIWHSRLPSSYVPNTAQLPSVLYMMCICQRLQFRTELSREKGRFYHSFYWKQDIGADPETHRNNMN